MPRQSHGRTLHSEPRRSRQRKQKRGSALDALEVAEKQTPDSLRIRQNRLGEIEHDEEEPKSRADADGRSSKRRKVNDTRKLDDDIRSVDEERDLASGSDDEGGRWHEGIQGSDEDSDIDSDEAFGSSDEETFAEFSFRGSRSATKPSKNKPAVRKPRLQQNVDLNEENGWQDATIFNEDDRRAGVNRDPGFDEEEADANDSDSLGEDAVDLATALDMNLEEEREENERMARNLSKAKISDQLKRKHAEAKHSDSDEDADDNTDDDSDSDESLQLSISDADADGDHTELRSFVAGLDPLKEDRTNVASSRSKVISGKPSTFGLGSAKISAADLAQYITDPAQRQSLKLLQMHERAGGDGYNGGIAGKLAAPLAKRQQDKLDRVAAYEKSKETLGRWIDTVKANRRSDHISFPLPDPGSMGAMNVQKLQQLSHSTPQTDLENTIQTILEESGMHKGQQEDFEDQEAAFEELEEKKIPLEDVRERRAQLRLARELMFREEIRAKRIKKIKSKAYRRVHRKERDKIEAQQKEQLAAAGLLNSDEEREKNDRRRAEERMGARHKESKWAKGVKQAGRAAWDDDARIGVSELAKRDEELRRRVDGRLADESDISASDSESEPESDNTDMGRKRLEEKLANLEAKDNLQSKLGSMAFMQRAEAARKAINDEEIRQLRLAISDEMKDSGSVSDDLESFRPAGRQKYGVNSNSVKPAPRVKPKQEEFEALLSEDELADGYRSAASVQEIVHTQHNTQAKQCPSEKHRKPQKPANKSSLQDQSGSRLSTDHTPPEQQAHTNSLAAEANPAADYTSPSDSEDEARTPPYADDDKAALAAAIFTGPNDAVREFQKEKALVVEEEGDQVVDNTLPGWGSWTGAGISKREQKKGKGRFLTTIAGVTPEKRQDAKLDKVIVNEKRVKKTGKYLATELPHPFESRQQYERSLRLPMGPEWSTVNHFQDAIKPRVLLKQGSVIKPIAKPRR